MLGLSFLRLKLNIKAPSPSKLLENVVARILDKIMETHPKISFVEVSVAKKNPPINGDVREVVVKDNRTKSANF